MLSRKFMIPSDSATSFIVSFGYTDVGMLGPKELADELTFEKLEPVACRFPGGFDMVEATKYCLHKVMTSGIALHPSRSPGTHTSFTIGTGFRLTDSICLYLHADLVV